MENNKWIDEDNKGKGQLLKVENAEPSSISGREKL